MGLSNLLNGTASRTGVDLLEQLSRQNDWEPNVRRDNVIVHYFKGDAITPRRDVIIALPPGSAFATFSCRCRATFLARDMTTPQLALFLARNDESVFGKWQITIEDGVVSAHLRYPALTGGLEAGIFRSICSSMVEEVAFVEKALHGEGLL